LTLPLRLAHQEVPNCHDHTALLTSPFSFLSAAAKVKAHRKRNDRRKRSKAAKAAAAAADQAKLDAIPNWKKDLNTKLVTKKTQQSEAARKQAYDKLSATQKMAYDRQHAGYWW